TVWPWSEEPLVIAEPTGRGSEVAGAIVLIAPTQTLGGNSQGAGGRWGWASSAPLARLGLVAIPLSGWVLHPTRGWSAATGAGASGDLEVRVDAERGPPELRRLADSFNTMVEVVRNALERQRAFVSEASHQLRNPLASLRLSVENLAPHLRTEDAREAHAIAVDETTVMHRMLNSLLAATRLESVTGIETVEIAEVLETRIERWWALSEAHDIEMVTDVPAGVW